MVDSHGADGDHVTIPTDAFGYRRMLAWARERTTDADRRVWAIEGTGSFGAGFTTYLLEQGDWVVEIDRPKRPARRNGARTDTLDAYRAREALTRELLAQPRRRMVREAIRVLLTTREGARYRLNRSGDRQLNRALHTIVLSRIRFHPETRSYAEGRTLRRDDHLCRSLRWTSSSSVVPRWASPR